MTADRTAAQERLRALVRDRLRGSRPVVDPGRWRVPVRNVPSERLLRERLQRGAVPAAVLVPVLNRPEGLSVLLTRRAEHLRDHAGQISFPGGRLEEEDSGPAAAALREMEEEVGIPRRHVDLLGYLDTYLTGTGFAVTPVVGLVHPAAEPVPDPGEVAEVFEVPLQFLIDPGNHGAVLREVRGVELEFFEITYQRYRIWGATAGIIVGLYERLIVKKTVG